MANVKEALLRYGEFDPYPVQFNILPHRLFDQDSNRALVSDIASETSASWVRTVAANNTHRLIPAEPGIYMFVWRPEIRFHGEEEDIYCLRYAIYIGSAGGGNSRNTLRSRFKSEYMKFIKKHPDVHWQKPDYPLNRDALLKRYLSLWDLEYWYITIPNRDRILEFEKRLIRSIDPPVNKQLKSKRAKLGEFRPAF